MDDIIELHSRGEDRAYLKKLSKQDKSESKTYVLKLSNPFIRTGFLGGKKFIDPSGGPFIQEGELLEEANAVVKSVDFTIGYGYTITFK